MNPSTPPSSKSRVRLGSVPDDPGAGLEFVQERLALFGKSVAWICGAFVVLAVVLAVAGVNPFFQPGRASQLVAAAISIGVWLVARQKRPLSAMALMGLDSLGTLGTCICLVVMGHQYALTRPWGVFAGTLAVFHVVMARAIIIPSTPKRTLGITAFSFFGLVVSTRLLPPQPGMPSGELMRWVALLGPLTWSSTGTALATLASQVIYGLQEKVMEARQLGQYTLEEKIGAGGMGEVYRARHAMLRRPTAIKLLAGEVSSAQLSRFEKEVQLTALLTHPNTISIYDYGRTPEGTFYYAMELLEGLTLEELVEGHGPQPPGRVIRVLAQACGALDEAHNAGLIHRDIKPANIFLCQRGGMPDVVKVLDFGLVKQLESDGEVQLSNVNSVIGTPLYMPPEAILSPDKIDRRSDLYALGAVGYFLLSGVPVFTGKSIVEVCSQHLHSEPVPPSERVTEPVPPDLEKLVLRCLAKDPAARPASAHELLTALRDCTDADSYGDLEARTFWQTRQKPNKAKTSSDEKQRTVVVDLEQRLATLGARSGS
ncbi:MAG TPA: serine/threonine-protein kinase [Polyangiaceae bacterium]|nr:serine/threonine-protein kinase [Polyangiaceae bacterium]